MDPLSVTASIIAVLQATSAVVSICYDYSSALKGSSWELLKVIDEVRDLRNVLESVERLARQDESSNSAEPRLPSLRLLCKPDTGLLPQCLRELNDLDKKLRPPNYPSGSKRRALVQASGWPLKKGAVEKTLINIGRLKSTLALALTADETSLMIAIQDTSTAILENTVHTQKNVSSLFDTVTLKNLEDLREKIYEWLSPPDPSSNYNKARGLCQVRTGSWFIQSNEYADWIAGSNSFLWLHGIPGCGKTILCSTIVENIIGSCQSKLASEGYLGSESAVLQFYFDFNDIEKQSHEKMICSLIMQLCSGCATIPRPLESLYTSYVISQRQPTTEALLATLRELVQDHQDVFLVIDALDECNERDELLSALSVIAEWNLGMHILVTSRREADIGETLSRIGPNNVSIQSALVNNDIRAYVQERLNNDPKLRRWKKKKLIQDEIETTLMEKAGGMFRWVVCQLDALGKCLTMPMLRKALQSLPNTLDETYARILHNIDESWSQYVIQILEWLVYSATPLKLTEVAELVAIDIDDDPPFDPDRRLSDPKDILAMCSSLITMSKEKSRGTQGEERIYEDITHEYFEYEDIAYEPTTKSKDGDESIETKDSKIIVRLAHFSVKEYLVSRHLTVGPTLQCTILETPVNATIAETCLVYLFQFDKPDSLTPKSLESFPLLSYAARNWITHARIAGNHSQRLAAMIVTLFLNRGDVYENWIRIFDPEKNRDRPSVWQYSIDPCSPLYYCSLGGLLEPAKQLIQKGVNVNSQEGDLGCPLLAALSNQHEDIARILVESGADVTASAPDWHVGMTALHCAARDGYLFLVENLLSKEATVEAKTDSGETPLHMAAENGHMEITQQLVAAGADIEAQDNSGNTPLHNAVYSGDRSMMDLLLGKGADLNKKDDLGRTPAYIAVETRRLDILHILLNRGAETRSEDIRGQTLVHYAAANGLADIVELLLDDMDLRDKLGRTALHLAADAGYTEVVAILLRADAEVEAQSTSGKTPLYYAAVAGHVPVVQRLLEAGASLKARDRYGGSILYAAATAGEPAEDAVDVLLNEIEFRSGLGRTLLHHAAAAGDVNMVQLLVGRNADLDAKTAAGETALYLAMAKGHDKIVHSLLAAKKPHYHRGNHHRRNRYMFDALYDKIVQSLHVAIPDLELQTDNSRSPTDSSSSETPSFLFHEGFLPERVARRQH